MTLRFRHPNGTWTGVVGDLIRGDIDISVAALTMTTEREEGISLIILISNSQLLYFNFYNFTNI